MRGVRGIAALGLALLVATPALAGYVTNQPKGSAVGKAARLVAQQGCSIDAMEWQRLIVQFGGSESDAVWHISEMTRAGEAVIRGSSLQLKGVFGC